MELFPSERSHLHLEVVHDKWPNQVPELWLQTLGGAASTFGGGGVKVKKKKRKQDSTGHSLYIRICSDDVIDDPYCCSGSLRVFLTPPPQMHLKVSLPCTHYSFYFTSIICNLSQTTVPIAFMFPTPWSGAPYHLPNFLPFFDLVWGLLNSSWMK